MSADKRLLHGEGLNGLVDLRLCASHIRDDGAWLQIGPDLF